MAEPKGQEQLKRTTTKKKPDVLDVEQVEASEVVEANTDIVDTIEKLIGDDKPQPQEDCGCGWH
jgi:hypothetical protein